jgi:hypothetical protein
MSLISDENRDIFEQKFVQVLADISEKKLCLTRFSMNSNVKQITFLDRIGALKKMREVPTENSVIEEDISKED